MPLSAGTRLGPYEILAPIGVGGMGEVYRATDTKLGRDVAVKVLPAEMAHDVERLARFRREAKALAQLDHPNIVTIYSVEESDGVHFLTMQLVDGQPLDRLIPEGGFPIDRILDVGTALADALAAAHEKGIVHRDLKPANVMVTNEERVKVLDFGLAKDISAQAGNDATVTSAGHTQAGIVMGTPAYMSPEQVSGRSLDHRSDIFSLGVLLHEMASGKRPFEGGSSAELFSSILRDTPTPVTEQRADLPADLARVIRRCLEKDPRNRMQTARDVSNEFRDMARTPTRSGPAARLVTISDSGAVVTEEGFWVAVLPFKYTGGNPDLVALAEGLTDDIVTNMSKFSYLRVVARSSTAQYARQTVDVRTAAKELGARYVMEGSIRQAGAKIRIAAQLVDASSGAGFWAETYDRAFNAEATLDLLDDVVPRIVATVGDTQGILAHSMIEALRNRDPESFTPYEALLRSFGFHQHVSEAEHLAGRTALEQAVKKAPDRADCWAMLSWLYRAEYSHGYNLRPDPMDRALASARRAVELAPSNQLAQAALASALFFRKELAGFRSTAERALALNHMEGYTTAFLGMHFAFSGDWDRGCALSERSTQLNPHHPGWYWLPLVFDAYRRRDGKRALEYLVKVNMPGLWTAQIALAVVYNQLGEMEKAHAAVRDLVALRPSFAAKAREELGIWWQPEMVEQLLGDLRKAGLDEGPAKTDSTSSQSSATAAAAKTPSGETRAEEGFWVAVLPFRYKGADQAVHALADGLTDEIITGLSRFSYLRVIARGSTAKYSVEAADVRAIGTELGARYAIEGNVRHAGVSIRLAVHLVDAASGAHLWAETYERPFRSDDIFALQDELVPRIVSTVADMHGVLPRSMSHVVRRKAPDSLTPYEALLRSFGYNERFTPEDLAETRASLERAVHETPGNADCWAMLSLMYSNEHGHWDQAGPQSLDDALAAARKAVELSPMTSLPNYALAQALFFHRDFEACRVAAEKAVSLNPMDGATAAFMGLLIAYSGDWEHGCPLAESGLKLNPNQPGWYRYTAWHDAYRKHDYRKALEIALQLNAPKNYYTHAVLAMCYGQLGDVEKARKAIRDMLALKPDYAEQARSLHGRWIQPELVEELMDGLCKAGLEIPANAAPSSPSHPAVRTTSGETRTEEGFWVAVLPFRYKGADQAVHALADGLTEEIITGLSRFTYLRVVARNSTARYSSEPGDVQAIGKGLGARYVMEGSIRQAGSNCRVTVQLVDAVTGAHLWAETYDRAFNPDGIFALQDELAPRIVSTVADAYGVLPHSMSQAVRGKPIEDLTPYEGLLRSFSYGERVTAEEYAPARSALERAVEQAPTSSDCWAMLSILLTDGYIHGFDAEPGLLDRALGAARRAVDTGLSNHKAHQALAWALFFRKDFKASRVAAERTIALNPMDAYATVFAAQTIALGGDWERGCPLILRAMELNPHHPGWYWYCPFLDAYRKSDYRAALDIALRINMPGFPLASVALAATYAQLGELDAARSALGELLAARPDYPAVAQAELEKIMQPQLASHLVDGLRKAGLNTDTRGTR